MSDKQQQVMIDALAYLEAITAEGLPPPRAQERLRALQAGHGAVELELLWEEESCDGSFHYDLLVRAPGAATISLSVCPQRALPWPLRGVRRFSDANLVQVNGRMLTMEDGVGFLDLLWNEAPIMERMIDACLIREELTQRPIDLGDDELQEGLDGLRRAHRLYTASDTERWMQERGLDHERLERLVAEQLTCARLRRRLAEGRIASTFEARHADLDTADIARLELADEDSARRINHRVASGEMDFFTAAEHAFVANAAQRVEMATLRRREASADPLGAAVFAARPGEVVGPIRIGRSFMLARVLSLRPARDDEATRAAIEQILFDEWLAEGRARARVTWHWGHAPVTSPG